MAQDLLIATFRHRLPRSYKVVTDEESAKRSYIRSDTAADELGGIPNSTPHPPQCLPPYPPHSGTIPRIYRYTRPCSDSERNVKNMERIEMKVKTFFFQKTVMWKNKPRCAIFKWCWIYTKEKLHLKSDFSINNKKEESLRWFNKIVIWLETVLWESDSDFFAFFLGEENEIRIYPTNKCYNTKLNG